MSLNRICLAAALALGLSACARVEAPESFEGASRAAASPEVAVGDLALPDLSVREIIVEVPRDLRVNEKNSYRPRGEIVWHEDPIGNRREQVRTIMQDGLRAGTDRLDGDTVVDLHIELAMFHAVTDKARYSIGGVHELRFWMTLLDPATGQPLTAPHFVKADFEALGGNAAIAADARGLTQKARIQQQLAHVIHVELTEPGGYKPEVAGVFSLLDNL